MEDSPSLDLLFDLALVRNVIVKDLERSLSGHGVNLSDFTLLTLLYRAPDRRLRRAALAERLGVTTSGVARQLGPLERIGLVDREASEHDARLAIVLLTDAGVRTVEELQDVAGHRADAALDRHWSGAEQQRLAALLSKALR